MLTLFRSMALAILWFTRIPLPFVVSDAERLQQQSLAWLPWIGLLVGSMGYGVMWLAAGWGTWVAALLGTAAMVFVTGALHEDGWADGWDALGAGGSRERRLLVLKDPRLGTFGVTALLFSLVLQVSFASILMSRGSLILLVVAQVASRIPLSLLAWTVPYARPEGEGKAGFLRKPVALWAWCLWGLTVLLGLGVCLQLGVRSAAVALIAMLVCLLSAQPWKKILGGITGDVFGFCQQAGFLAGLLMATWRPS